MKTVEIMENLFFIQRGYLNANHFVYRSEQPVLIDTAYIADFRTTEELIKRLGVDLTGTTLIVNTHCHCDHIAERSNLIDLSHAGKRFSAMLSHTFSA